MTTHPDGAPEIVLKGGRANTGNVVRIGNQVARPTYPQTPSVDHFLQFLLDEGLDFVPTPLGIDDQHRQRLSFVEGVTPTAPYSPWAFDEGLLIALAERQRDLHRAARRYQPPVDAVWAVSAGNYFPAAALQDSNLIVCHNDLGMTNTVVDAHGNLSGLIDFDYCKPVDRLFDIAVAARHWAPFGDLDIEIHIELDRLRRFQMFCDVHELTRNERRRVVELAAAFLEHARSNIKALAAAGGVGFQALLDNGYEATNLATVDWLQAHAEALANAR